MKAIQNIRYDECPYFKEGALVLQMHFEEQTKLRERRHDQLMRMIAEYQLTDEEIDYLLTIKRNTEIEIASRFVRSKHNKHYRFPFREVSGEEEREQFPRGISFDHTTYDLRSQNYVGNHQQMKSQREEAAARRVKSLGQQKFDERMVIDIKKELRERPQERGSQRQRIVFPELNRKIGSQKILKTEQNIKSRQFSLKLIRNNNIQVAREEISKQRRYKKIGDVLGSKLLTEGGDLISFGHAKVMINKLRVVSPGKNGLKRRQ